MKQYVKRCMSIFFIITLASCLACAKKQVKDDTTAMQPPAGTAAEQPEAMQEGVLEESDLGSKEFKEITEDEAELRTVFKDIHFDFDDFSLRPDAKETLNGIAEWLLKNTATQILIEGHCDERGTNEYNLALGERRAKSAKKYLVQLGLAPKRISTISYGEEKPLDPGHTEEAWAKNRRDHFLIR